MTKMDMVSNESCTKSKAEFNNEKNNVNLPKVKVVNKINQNVEHGKRNDPDRVSIAEVTEKPVDGDKVKLEIIKSNGLGK